MIEPTITEVRLSGITTQYNVTEDIAICQEPVFDTTLPLKAPGIKLAGNIPARKCFMQDRDILEYEIAKYLAYEDMVYSSKFFPYDKELEKTARTTPYLERAKDIVDIILKGLNLT